MCFIVMNLVQEEIKNGIPSEKIIIGGFSQGGATALYTALTSSMRFGGILALSTWLPLHSRFPEQLKPCEGLFTTPILQCHGDVDPMVSLGWSQLSMKFLQQMGFSNVRFKVYPGLSHSSSPDVIIVFFKNKFKLKIVKIVKRLGFLLSVHILGKIGVNMDCS